MAGAIYARRRIAALAATVLAVVSFNAGFAPTAQAAGDPQTFTPFGLTNGFGTDAQTQRVISWLGANTAKYSAPYIKVSPQADAVASAATTPCTASTVPAPMSAYSVYTCTLTALSPGTTYVYRVGASQGAATVESPSYSFATAGGQASFTFLDFTDTQSTPVSTYDSYWGNNLRTALQQTPEAAFAIATGDLIEAGDTPNVENWFKAVGTSVSGIALNPVLGNHDEPVSAMWGAVMPRASLTDPNAYGSFGESSALQYAYVFGNALFLQVNTNLDTASQLRLTTAWIKDTVAKYGHNPDGADRFIIVVEHKSPFGGVHSGAGTYPTGDFNNPNIVAELPKTYDEVGVDLVLAGHDHNLIRSLPVTWNYTTNKAQWDRSLVGKSVVDSTIDGLVYDIGSFAGQKSEAALTTPSASTRPWISNYQHFDSAVANDAYTAVTVDASSIQVRTYRVGTASPVLLDSFTVIQSPTPSVGLTKPAITGDAEAGGVLTVQTTATPVTANLTYEWLSDGAPVQSSTVNTYTVKPADAGHQITVRVTATAPRMDSTIMESDPVAVSPVIRMWVRFAQDSWAIDDRAASLKAAVEIANCASWKITDDASWLTETPTSGTTAATSTVSATANTSPSARTGTVTVAGCGLSSTLVVTQAPLATLTLSASTWAAPVLGGSGSLATITNQAGWQASVPTTVTWLSVTPAGAAGEPLTLTAQPNTSAARSATVTVRAGSVTRNVTVTQAVPTLTATPAAYTFAWTGGGQAIRVAASVGTWVIDPTTVPSWLTVTDPWDASIETNASWLMVSAATNLGAARTATLTLTSAGVKRTVTLTQAAAPAATLTLSASAWTAPSGSGGLNVKVTSNRLGLSEDQAWQAATDADWLHVLTDPNPATSTLVVYTDPNTETVSRVGHVTVSQGTLTRSLTVTQPGKGVGETLGYTDMIPSATTVVVSTALTGATATSSAAWLTAKIATDGTVSLTATANSGVARYATVTLAVKGVVTASFPAWQTGVWPTLACGSSWAAPAAGGSQLRTITAGAIDRYPVAQWAASPSDSWVHASFTGVSGTQMAVATDRNTTSAARTATVWVNTATSACSFTVTQPA